MPRLPHIRHQEMVVKLLVAIVATQMVMMLSGLFIAYRIASLKLNSGSVSAYVFGTVEVSNGDYGSALRVRVEQPR